MEQNNSYPGEQWKPIFDYMVDTFDVSLTLSQMEALVNGVSKVTGYAALLAKCDKYEKALREARTWVVEALRSDHEATVKCAQDDIKLIDEALSGDVETCTKCGRKVKEGWACEQCSTKV